MTTPNRRATSHLHHVDYTRKTRSPESSYNPSSDEDEGEATEAPPSKRMRMDGGPVRATGRAKRAVRETSEEGEEIVVAMGGRAKRAVREPEEEGEEIVVAMRTAPRAGAGAGAEGKKEDVEAGADKVLAEVLQLLSQPIVGVASSDMASPPPSAPEAESTGSDPLDATSGPHNAASSASSSPLSSPPASPTPPAQYDYAARSIDHNAHPVECTHTDWCTCRVRAAYGREKGYKHLSEWALAGMEWEVSGERSTLGSGKGKELEK